MGAPTAPSAMTLYFHIIDDFIDVYLFMYYIMNIEFFVLAPIQKNSAKTRPSYLVQRESETRRGGILHDVCRGSID